MTQISTFSGFATQLREFIQKHSGRGAGSLAEELEFNRLATELFGLQFQHNAAYRRFCEGRKFSPQNIRDWREIPAMPAAGFKELELTSLAVGERTRVFHSSGTTAQVHSRHFHGEESLAIYDSSLLAWFRVHFPTAEGTTFLALTPRAELVPHSSLVHMFETLGREFGLGDSVFAGGLDGDGTWNIDFAKAVTVLREWVAANRPVILLGTAFNFVHLLDWMAEEDLRFELPPGSCVLETGGYKSRSRGLPKAELHGLISERLGISGSEIICEYGMSELSSQGYDGVAGAANGARVFRFAPWARVQIVNPETGREAGEAETGLIRIFDLANVYSVMAIQTEDLGVRRGEGFELLGRAALAETRGCSLMSV